MARNFRYYGKKRGDRRTGSRMLGSVGEMIFYAAFLLLGCVSGAMFFSFLAIPQWRVNNEFVKSTCVVLEKRINETADDDGPQYRPEFRIRYEIDDVTYLAWTYDIHMSHSGSRENAQQILARFAVTEDLKDPINYYCWYDPTSPEKAVLVRGTSWWLWLVFIVPASFVLIGGGGLIYSVLRWGKSAERRAAMVQRAIQRDLFDANGKAARKFPNVPNGVDITSSPGTTLAYRLPIGASPAWKLFAVLLACVLWNGIVSVFVIIAASGHLEGNPDWGLSVFLLPFVAVGIALVVFLVRQLMATTGVGPTTVEISDHPLLPGKQYELLVSQSGRLRVNSLCVSLVCNEQATYRQGTDTRRETRLVHRREIYRREGFEVGRGLPFEARCALTAPEAAMHSFKADHNEIQWQVVVAGNAAGWGDFQRSFPVILRPATGNNNP